jgi:hypothetical protein
MTASTGQTGAAWQRAALAAAGPGCSRERALAAMLDRYLACAATGQPVHTWPVTSWVRSVPAAGGGQADLEPDHH